MKKNQISVIVPIYNNGQYLKDRCMKSLMKSSIFNDMEILFIDDGSTDDETIKIIKELEIEHDNVKTYYFPRGGSGNASRPRNKGAELATCDYITYLDPDNEAVNDGYYKLYKQLENCEFDIILGNYEFVEGSSKKISNYYNICEYYNFDCREITNTKDLIIKNNFSVNSIQAMLVKKSIILNNNVTMEGIGEDTVFFYEVMLLSRKVKVINEVIHLYYKDREGSLTNSINNEYFDGHFMSQKRKKKIFENFGILESYLNTKQEYHFKHYLYNKMLQANEKKYREKILYEIYDIYEGRWNVKDKDLRRFFERR